MSLFLLKIKIINKTRNNSAICCRHNCGISPKKTIEDMKKHTEIKAIISPVSFLYSSYKPRGTSEKNNGYIILNIWSIGKFKKLE
jgi:hypothetical protein